MSGLHVSKLRGFNNFIRKKFKRQGITYAEQLLTAVGHREDRARFSRLTGLDEDLLLRLARRADLTRIKGVGATFADLLELQGVYSVADLAIQDPRRLHTALVRLNTTQKLARRAPTDEEVADWVHQAESARIFLENSSSP